jgi:hypothetical protein
MREKRNACGILAGKPEGKKPLGRPRGRWVDNIDMDLGEKISIWLRIETSGRVLVNTVMNLRVP